ncbi:MAG: hypothetical protein JWM89_1306 [Acidimicrobiales bacterium]|nr:hypothetical protein [Acidimicrobiales bacterium]
MSSWDDSADARQQLEAAFETMHEELAYIRGGGLTRRQSRVNSRVRLSDIYVAIRSDLDIDLVVANANVEEVVLNQGILELGRGENPAGPRVVSSSSPNINTDFFHLLMDRVGDLLENKPVQGLRLTHRPLISAPLWNTGTKAGIAIVDVSSAVNAFNRTVLLGPPGSGKSTLAKTLALAHLRPQTRLVPGDGPPSLGLWRPEPLLPVYIELRQLVSDPGFPPVGQVATADDFMSYVHRHVCRGSDPVYRYFAQQLILGDAIMILDGLDEVPIPHDVPDALDLRRDQITGFIQSICDRYPSSRVLVTSRPAGYSGWTLAGFEVLHLVPLSVSETEAVIHALYRGMGHDAAWSTARTHELLGELQFIPENLRSQPLFVALLAQLFEEPGVVLPRQRGALLAEAIDLLLGAWSMPRVGEEPLTSLLGCTPDQLRDRLREIALQSLKLGDNDSAGEKEIPRSLILDELYELGNTVNPSGALEYVSQHAGILVSPAPRRYRFAHRLFQEYLAASGLARREDPVGEIVALARQSTVTWREVALLLGDVLAAARRMGDVWDLVLRLADDEEPSLIVLAAQLVNDQGPTTALSQIYSYAIDAVRVRFELAIRDCELSGTDRACLGSALDVLGDERPGVGVIDDAPDIAWVAVQPGLATLGTDEAARAPLGQFALDWDFGREEPLNYFEVAGFMISKYPVTIAQYQLFAESKDGFKSDDWWPDGSLLWRTKNGPAGNPGGLAQNCPQVNVTWYEAVAFCNWLSKVRGESIRLPTEAEWEWVARGERAFLYPWGNQPTYGLANTREEEVGRPTSVGVYPSASSATNPDVCDLIGNVWEWCSSAVDYDEEGFYRYPYELELEAREQLTGGDRMKRATRGGYFGTTLAVARSSLRGRDMPSIRVGRQGFRVVRDLEPGEGQ